MRLEKSLSVLFELSVKSPTGVFRKTIPTLVRQTVPFKAMEGSTSTGAAGGGVSADGACAAGSDSLREGACAAADELYSTMMAMAPARQMGQRPESGGNF